MCETGPCGAEQAVAAAKGDATVGSTVSQSSGSGEFGPSHLAQVSYSSAANWLPSGSAALDGVFASLVRCASLHGATSPSAGSLMCPGAGATANGAVSASSAADGVFASSTGGSGQAPLLQTGGNEGASSASASEMAADSGCTPAGESYPAYAGSADHCS
jgi:hypothetical protein